MPNLVACTHDADTQALLSSYADYIVGDVCFRLKFDTLDTVRADSGLPALLVAVVQHVGLDMVPFLSDVVHTLLHALPQAHGLRELGPSTPEWVLRVLASIARQLARLICEQRLRERPALGEAAEAALGEGANAAPSAFAGFLLGARREWRATPRLDGFFLTDLGLYLNEDPEPPEDPEESLGAGARPSMYARERAIATSILMWSRHFLQAPSLTSRHLAHVAGMHALTVLSTRVKELLPRVHDLWPSVVPSFSDQAPLAVQADAYVLLKHMSRLSGDFVRQRFVTDCWPGMWARLKSLPPAQECAADAWSPKLKAQLAALDALAFLSGDTALVQGVTEELLVVALKFAASGTAECLRRRAWALLEPLAGADSDLLRLYVGAVTRRAELPGGVPHSPSGADLPLLAEASVGAMAAGDCQRLAELAESAASGQHPRVPLSFTGELWSQFLLGRSLHGESSGG